MIARVRTIIQEASKTFTEETPVEELKEALIDQAVQKGKSREEVEAKITESLEAAERDPTVKKGLISYLNNEINKTQGDEADE